MQPVQEMSQRSEQSEYAQDARKVRCDMPWCLRRCQVLRGSGHATVIQFVPHSCHLEGEKKPDQGFSAINQRRKMLLPRDGCIGSATTPNPQRPRHILVLVSRALCPRIRDEGRSQDPGRETSIKAWQKVISAVCSSRGNPRGQRNPLSSPIMRKIAGPPTSGVGNAK
jgi:hypothetical protein